MERMHLTAAMPLLAINTCDRKQARQKSETNEKRVNIKKHMIWNFIHFLNDTGAPESGDKLSWGGHGKVPL